MVHSVIAVIGPKIWYDLFLSDLEKQQYTYNNNIGGMGIIGARVNELHFLDIATPEQNRIEMLADIAPFVKPSSPQKKAALSLANKVMSIMSKITRSNLKRITEEPLPTHNVRTKGINVMPLFWYEDQKDLKAEWILPKGGELL